MNIVSFRICSRALSLLAAVLITVTGLGYTAGAQNADKPSPGELILILDASGSMWGQIEGDNKITIAKKVLKDLIDGLPENTSVGLIVYGHRDKGDCKDIETVVPPGPVNKKLLSEKIDAISPKGKTPITDSVNQAFEIVRGSENAATVILVSDGLETCGGDPCRAVEAAKGSGINFVMHVVGFDVAKEDVSQLECAAQAGGGLYLSATNAGELSSALETAVELPADLPAGRLSVKVTAEGKLKDTTVNVIDTKTGEVIGTGRTYASKETNPRIIPLPDGVYDVEVIPLGIKGADKQIIKGVEIKQGETVEKTVDFGFGELTVGVTRNGSLSDATVTVYEPGTKNYVAGGRTYGSPDSNPKRIKLSPGVYDISVGSVEIADKPLETIPGVEIKSGATTEKSVEFKSGILMVGASSGGELADATIYITDSKTGEPVAGGRTYTNPNNNPKEYVLSPGTYKVVVKAVKLKEALPKEFEVVVKQGETVERNAQFSE